MFPSITFLAFWTPNPVNVCLLACRRMDAQGTYVSLSGVIIIIMNSILTDTNQGNVAMQMTQSGGQICKCQIFKWNSTYQKFTMSKKNYPHFLHTKRHSKNNSHFTQTHFCFFQLYLAVTCDLMANFGTNVFCTLKWKKKFNLIFSTEFAIFLSVHR